MKYKLSIFEELLEQKKDVSKYVGTLNAIERNYYQSIVQETETIDSISSDRCRFDLEKKRRDFCVF